ncbi:UvrD-helicase domain-containing protein [bacterium]|nr:UvrD-helicase domain-containing protein [bacterium]
MEKVEKIGFDGFQTEALKLAGNIAVSASAGTGKTRTLVGAYLRLLGMELEGEPRVKTPFNPEELVAITFTDKAAAEMRVKIRQEIEKLVNLADNEIEKRNWEYKRRKLDLATISTFHSFCTKILREHPVEARVDPAFAILEEDTATELLNNAVKECIFEALREGEKGIEGLVYRMQFSGIGHKPGFFDSISKVLNDIRGKDIEISMDPQNAERKLREKVRDRINKERERAFRVVRLVEKFYCGVLESMSEPGFKRTKAGFWERLDEFLVQWPKYIEKYGDKEILAEDSIKRLEYICSLFKNGWGSFRRSGQLPSEQVNSIKNSYEYIKKFEYFEKAHIDLIKIIVNAIQQYEAEKKKISTLDFDDLQIKVVKLFNDYPGILKQYYEDIKYLLVDEYQDTNQIQGIIVRALATGELKLHGDTNLKDTNRLFIVGDKKQSIYRFRGADVTVFDKDMKLIGNTKSLKTSYRSRPELIEFYNGFFKNYVMVSNDNPEAFEVKYDESHDLEPHRKGSNEIAVEYLENCDAINLDIDGVRQEEGKAIAARINLLVSGKGSLTHPLIGDVNREEIKYGDIAILLRGLTKVELIEMALEKKGIPYVTIGGRGFFDTQEIYDFYNFLRFLTYGDSMSLVGILRSPFVGLSDDTIYLIFNEIRVNNDYGRVEPRTVADIDVNIEGISGDQKAKLADFQALMSFLIERKDSLTLGQLLDTIIERTGYDSVLFSTFKGELRFANVTKLRHIARSFEGRGTPLVRDFVDYVKRNMESGVKERKAFFVDKDLDIVRIMTIHQAKGLQFPIVFVADTSRQMFNIKPGIHYSGEDGVLITEDIFVGQDYSEKFKSPRVQIFKDNEEAEEIAESKRLLYVAATRARDYLIFSGGKKTSSKKPNDWFNRWLYPFIENNTGKLIKVIDYNEIEKVETPDEHILRLNTDGKLVLKENLLMADDFPENMKAILDGKRFDNPLYNVQLSPTGLLDFEYCERYYYNKNILKLSRILDFELSVVPNEESPYYDGEEALQVGSFAHKVLELLDFDDSSIFESLKTIVDSERHNYDIERGTVDEVRQNLENFIRSVLLARVKLAREIHKEFPIWSKLGCVNGVDILLKGKADLVFVDKTGILNIMDYKYAKHREDDIDRYAHQLHLYALVLKGMEQFGAENVKMFLAFLKEQEQNKMLHGVLKGNGYDVDEFRDFYVMLGYDLGEKLLKFKDNIGKWDKVRRENAKGNKLVSLDVQDCENRGCKFKSICWK